ncbi:SCO family protein [Ottowia oryzae]|uniref:SCO family protein n=1 Tax=Ottowia oryzae TaxID=2109914 RepID=A0A2S0MDF6_9BURK|nr:SCO family protein [Ottowia oryzae]AVO33932.1 SCO family protein [Ottowia oryzae]
MQRRNALKSIAAGAVLAGASGVFLSACDRGKPQFHSVDITGAEYAKDFKLTDFDGKPRTLADFKGKAVVLFFGFTQCPDVCPTTMTELAQVKKLLGADGDKVQGLFVSIDPERDTPAVLKEYMQNFDPSFLGLYAASPEALAALAKDFKIYYKKVDGKTPTSYSMDHTAASYVYDPQGRLRLYARYGMGPEALAEDIRLLLKTG